MTLTVGGLPRNRPVTVQSWGVLGKASDGHLSVSYNLGAMTSGMTHRHYVKAGAHVNLAGTGLPNRPFGIEVRPSQLAIT